MGSPRTAVALSPEQLKKRFLELYGPGEASKPIHLVEAPGRVNLIGEHTDYNEGFVFPMAIEPSVLFACRGRSDDKVRIASTQFEGDKVQFSLSEKLEPSPRAGWANYVKGMAAELLAAGVPLSGMDCLLTNSLPSGSGLSSSAALEVGTARSLLAVSGAEVDSPRLAQIAQRAEHNFPRVMCGIMDQMIVANGQAGMAMLLDCRSLQRTYYPIDQRDLKVVIVNTMYKHALTGGEYNERRSQCESGVAAIAKKHPNVKSLRDATLDMLEASQRDMTPIVYQRCRHVISEIQRCLDFAGALTEKRYDAAGELMYASHRSLMNDYEVSIGHLDVLVASSMTLKGVYGARMTGAGFGGCIVALVVPREVPEYEKQIKSLYQRLTGFDPQVIVTEAADAARVIE